MTDTEALKQLNEDTFLAETRTSICGEEWDKFLWRVLTDDFCIKRANPALLPQDKRRMMTHIQYDANPARRNISDVEVFEDRDYGVVTSVVTLEGQTARFHNIKIFIRQSSATPPVWQCVYWRVTRLASE